MRFVMCQGASACVDQRVVEVDARTLQRRKKRSKCVFSLSAMRARVTVRPLPRGHVKQSGPPVYDRLVIIHTGGVCVQ